MIEIKPLNSANYKGKKYLFSYQTPGYYNLIAEEWSFRFLYEDFAEPQTRSFEDELIGDWLEKPVLFGAFENGALAGLIEGSMETWNNRFRISNIFVFEGYRQRQIGTQLMNHILYTAKKSNARMAVLETQSCNIPAIHFYLKMGFHIIGFDTCAYSNNDIEKHEIRIEMGLEL